MNSGNKSSTDPLVIARQVRHRVYDQVYVNPEEKSDEHRLIKKKLVGFLEKGQPDDFITWLNTAIPEWNKLYYAHYCLGVALKAGHKYEDADRHFRKSLEMAHEEEEDTPFYVTTVLMSIGSICLAKHDREGAWKYLDEAMKTTPDNFVLHHNRLCLASLEEDKSKIRNVFRQLEESLGQDWPQNSKLVTLLKTDGELAYLRSEVQDVWELIQDKINKQGEA
jgi:tetratricopeptide (TPR) repeat protein